MKRVTIGCGIGFDRFGKPITKLASDVLKSVLLKDACAKFGGATFTDTFGGWRDLFGRDVIEHGWSIVIYADKGAEVHVKEFARFVRETLVQEAVVLVVEEVEVTFI